jgi:hypothetical protein
MTTDIYGINIQVLRTSPLIQFINHDLTVVAITARPFGPHAMMQEKL